jgi:hypothetical protein
MLIPKSGLTALVTTVMAKRDYLSAGPHMTRTEAGWERPALLPADRGIRLADFLEAINPLPDPCPDRQAAIAICGVLRDRGHHFLLTALDEQWTARFMPEPEQDVPADPATDSGIPDGKLPIRHCAKCGAAYRPKRASSVYCGQNCRSAAYAARQRANGKQRVPRKTA